MVGHCSVLDVLHFCWSTLFGFQLWRFWQFVEIQVSYLSIKVICRAKGTLLCHRVWSTSSAVLPKLLTDWIVFWQITCDELERYTGALFSSIYQICLIDISQCNIESYFWFFCLKCILLYWCGITIHNMNNIFVFQTSTSGFRVCQFRVCLIHARLLRFCLFWLSPYP